MIAIFETKQLNDALRFLTQERVNYPQHASFYIRLKLIF
jgi:hypothetical protein